MKFETLQAHERNVQRLRPAIRALREKAGISQEQLAAKLQLAGLNLNQKAVSRIETGDRVVPDFELSYFATVLGVPVCTLLEYEK